MVGASSRNDRGAGRPLGLSLRFEGYGGMILRLRESVHNQFNESKDRGHPDIIEVAP
jgi:hypothetical protein